MPDPELVQVLDYILNKSDITTIDVLAEAVVRRRRNLSVFNAMGGISDPQVMAKEITQRINTGLGGGIENMRQSVREMIVKIIKEHAPEPTWILASICPEEIFRITSIPFVSNVVINALSP